MLLLFLNRPALLIRGPIAIARRAVAAHQIVSPIVCHHTTTDLFSGVPDHLCIMTCRCWPKAGDRRAAMIIILFIDPEIDHCGQRIRVMTPNSHVLALPRSLVLCRVLDFNRRYMFGPTLGTGS